MIAALCLYCAIAHPEPIRPDVVEIHTHPRFHAMQFILRPFVDAHRKAEIPEETIWGMINIKWVPEEEELEIRVSTEDDAPPGFVPVSRAFRREMFPR